MGHHHSPHTRLRARAGSAYVRLVSTLCAGALLLASLVWLAAPAQAAPFIPLGPPDGAGGFAPTPLVTLDQDNVPSGSTVDLTISACIPTEAQAGDSFDMSLPPQITNWPESFVINAEDGTPWVNVTVDQSVSPAVMTFTLTPEGASDDNDTVCFDALLGVTATSVETQTYELSFSISGVELTPKPVITIQGGGGCEPNCGPTPVSKPDGPYKSGWFNKADQCRTSIADCLTWALATPYADVPANFKAFTFTDPAQPGWAYNCSVVSLTVITSPDFADSSLTTYASLTLADAIAAGLVKNWSCSPTGVVVTLDNTALTDPGHQSMYLTVAASALAPGGSGAVTYRNSADIAAEGFSSSSSTSFSSNYFGSSARGDGIRIIKRDENGFDANTAAQSVTLTPPPGQTTASTRLIYTVRNTGTTTMRNLTVSDSVTTGGAAVTNFTCIFPDGTTGTTWAGPFAAKTQFECTADLTGVSGAHKNVGRVTGTGNRTLTRTDPYNAITPGTPVPLPVSVGDYVWYDTNRDGDQDDAELPVADVPVFLLDATGGVVAETTTDANGFYSFIDLDPGLAYTISFEAPEGTSITKQNAGGPDNADSDADPSTGEAPFTSPVTGANSETAPDDPTLDAGLIKYNLTLTKALQSAGPFAGGQNVEFTLTPHNDGPVDSLAGWSVTDLLPAGLTFVSMTGPASYSCADNVCTSSTPLAAGADGAPITVTATINQLTPGSLKNVAYVSPAGADVPEVNPLEIPTLDSNTAGSATDNDAEALVVIPAISVGDFVWWDEDRDGVQDANEAPIGDVTVNLLDENGDLIKTTTTNSDGFYSFTDLSPLTNYTVEFVKPTGTVFTELNDPASDGTDSDADLVTGRVDIVTPASGDNSASSPDDPTIDAGLMQFNLNLAKTLTTPGPYVSDQDVTFTLTPHNDGPVAALAGWSVTDLLPAGMELVSMTGAGYTCSANVCTANADLAQGANGPPISVVAKIVTEETGSLKNVAYISPDPADIDETNPLVVPTTDTDTTGTDTDNDAQAALEVKPVSIGDFVWWDVNRNGLQDAGEDPIEGVVVVLLDSNGNEIATTTTDGLGYYFFESLKPNTDYTVVFTKPVDAEFTTQNAGDDTLDSDPDPATGEIAVTTPSDGNNATPEEDDPTLDAGFVKYNLAIAKTLDTAGPFSALQEVTFTLTPHNDGPVNALAGWSVTDVLPAGLELVSMAGTGYTCVANVCTADAQLAAGEDGEPITVVAKIVAATPGRLHNVAYVSPDTDDVAETNPLAIPTTDTDTGLTDTDNDDQAALDLIPVSIGDYVWLDINRDGSQTDGEPVVSGVTVRLLDANGDEVASTETTATGFYSFTDLLPGAAYTVVFVAPDGTSFTLQTVAPDTEVDSNPNPATGEAPVLTPTTGDNSATTPDDPTIDAGLVKYNLLLDKTLDTEGPYYQGQTIEFTLTPSNEGPTDSLAEWTVTDVLPAGLSLVSMAGAGYTCTDNICTADAPLAAGTTGSPITVVAMIAADFAGETKNVAYVTPAEADGVETNPLGEVPTTDTDTAASTTDNDDEAPLTVVVPVRLGDYVWIDFNRDGLQDESDIPVEGATLTLTRADGEPVVDIFGKPVPPATTDVNGHYLFDDLPAGQYIVTIDPSTAPALAGYIPTLANAGEGDVDSSSGNATSAILSGGEQDLTLDFGFVVPKVKVGDFVWLDANHDGKQDAKERPLEGILLTLTGPKGEPVTDVFGNPVATVLTDAKGYYVFANLPVLPEGQHYTVTLDPTTVPAGLLPTKTNHGNPALDSSTGSAESGDVSVDGADDMTLDFGFYAPTPAIQIIKKDADDNDANTAETAAGSNTGLFKLKFSVVNIGNEDLVNLVVSDDVVENGKVTDLNCVFPDKSEGNKWAGPLLVSAQFDCTANLAARVGKHKDLASVTAVGALFGGPVKDDDAFHALVEATVLPDTGSPVSRWALSGIGGLLIAGCALMLVGRRRQA